MSKYQHTCIKPTCDNSYEDNIPDADYCEKCREENKALAKEIDRKMANRVSKRQESGFEAQVAGMKTVKGITFINLPQ